MKPSEMFLKKHKYSSRVGRKKPLLSAQNVETRLRLATEHISPPPEYWDDVIFSDEMKTMMYYHDGHQRIWYKPQPALENKNLIPTNIIETLILNIYLIMQVLVAIQLYRSY